MNLNFKNQNQTQIDKLLSNWIRTVTSNRVTKLDNNQFDVKTNFLLLNSIYFEGKWKYPFSTLQKQHTFYNQMSSIMANKPQAMKNGRKADSEEKLGELSEKEEKAFFNLTSNNDQSNDNVSFKPSKIEMMANLRTFNYAKADNGEFELIELPYEADLSMFIILPNYQIKMQYVLSKLNSTYLNQLIDRMDREQLRLMLPKFRIEQKLELKDSLQKLGLINLFNENVNFKTMFANQTNNNLFINQAIHNAFVNVDEKGSVAFSSTSLKSLVVSGFKEIIVQINRPFIFFIKDTIRDITLFSGTLCRFI